MHRVKLLLAVAAVAGAAVLLARRPRGAPGLPREADVDDGRPADGTPLELYAG